MTCLVSGCELAWFLMWLVLVTKTVASLISGCELALFLMWLVLVTETVSFQDVSWPGFQCALFW